MTATIDDAIITRLQQLTGDERHLVAEVIELVAEVDARRLYLAHGCASMFAFCTEVLGWAEGTAYHRVRAARAVQLFPGLVDDLAAGRLHVSGIVALAPHLCADNAAELLAAARGKTKRQIEQLMADRHPKPTVPTSVVPLGQDRYSVRFTAPATFRDKLDAARDLLAHAVPDGDVATILERALDVLLDKVQKKKLGQTSKPRRAAPPAPDSRHIPAQVKRAVLARDGQQCAFVGVDGRRCSATARLELHHEQPFARGGPTTVDNVSVRCAAHNRFEGERDFPGVAAAVRRRRASEPKAVNDERSHPPSTPTTIHTDALSALCNLGFKRNQVRTALAHAQRSLDDPSLEQLLREALRLLSPSNRAAAIA